MVRAKALFAGWGDEHRHGYGWVESACAGQDPDHGFEFLNDGIIKLGGCSFFGGNLKDNLGYCNAGRPPSHKNAAYRPTNVPLDSG